VGDIRIGTSGWHYPSGAGTWNGVFYPQRRPRGFDELAYYAERFDTVEINSSFYRVPEPAMTAAWVRRTPPAFAFSVKLYQKFTHPEMYVQRQAAGEWDVTREDLEAFRAGIGPIADAGRLAALLVQFPSSFQADPDTRGYLDWLLDALQSYPLAVELRHRSWSDDGQGTRALLEAKRAAWVLIDEPKFRSSIRQHADAQLDSAAPLAYIRFHGRNAATWWAHETADDRYNYLYTNDELRPFADTARTAAQKKRVLMYFNNHFSAKAVANAAVLKHDLGQLLPGDYATEMVERYSELKNIVTTERKLL